MSTSIHNLCLYLWYFHFFKYRGGNLSESEAEADGPSNEVVLSQPVSGRGNIVSGKSAVR